MASQDDLIIPVYLNQQIVFDLVAMLQGGIASVTQVTQAEQRSVGGNAAASGEFGLGKALGSLIKVNIAAGGGANLAGGTETVRSESRVHTPASLFILLRSILHSKEHVVRDGERAEPKPGDILEFAASLARNPLQETVGVFLEFMRLGQSLSDEPKGGKQKGDPSAVIVRQMKALIEPLEQGDQVDLITPPLLSGHRAVISLDRRYLNDPSMSDLVDGTFRVIGKVTRLLKDDAESLSLNRKSAVGRLPSRIMRQFSESLRNPQLSEFDIPPLEWEVRGPAIQVIPIAIFA